MPCIIASLSRLILFRFGVAAGTLNTLLTETNHFVSLALLGHHHMRLSSVSRSFPGLVYSRQPKLFHFVFDALRDCHGYTAFSSLTDLRAFICCSTSACARFIRPLSFAISCDARKIRKSSWACHRATFRLSAAAKRLALGTGSA